MPIAAETCGETSYSGKRAKLSGLKTSLQVLLANVLVKIGAVFTIALPLVWLGGLLYHCTSGESLQISLFKVYAVLYRAPGDLPVCLATVPYATVQYATVQYRA